MKQKKDETLIDFAERARKLLRTKTAMYSQLSKEQRDEYNRLASRSFIKGLNNVSLKQRVTTRGANSLEKAIENAIDMELDTINQVSQNELFCRSCRLIGHRERDCRRRNNDNSAVSTLINALKNIGNSNFNRRNNTTFTRNNQQSRFMPRNFNSSNNFNKPFFQNNRNNNSGYSNFNPGYSNPGFANNGNNGSSYNNSGYQRNFERMRNFNRENDNNYRRTAPQPRNNNDTRDNQNNNYRRNINNNRPNQVNLIRANSRDRQPANIQEN